MRPGADRVRSCLESAGVKGADVTVQALGVVCRVPPSRVVPALRALKDTGYRTLVDAFVADTRRNLEVTYHLRAEADGREAYVRARAGYDAVLHSASEIFPAAAMAEREAAEMFGMTFTGIPDMRRLLTTGETSEPPMRKAARHAPKGRAR